MSVLIYFTCTRLRTLWLFIVFLVNCCLLNFCAEYLRKYATEEALKEQEEMSSSSESSISDFSEDEAQDMEL